MAEAGFKAQKAFKLFGHSRNLFKMAQMTRVARQSLTPLLVVNAVIETINLAVSVYTLHCEREKTAMLREELACLRGGYETIKEDLSAANSAKLQGYIKQKTSRLLVKKTELEAGLSKLNLQNREAKQNIAQKMASYEKEVKIFLTILCSIRDVLTSIEKIIDECAENNQFEGDFEKLCESYRKNLNMYEKLLSEFEGGNQNG